MKFIDTSIKGDTVHLDGNEYHRCEFTRCRLVYSGGELPVFMNCKIDHCVFTFDGSAGRTLEYMRMLSSLSNGALVEEILATVKGANSGGAKV